ncbi:MAG: hypothetical protein KAX47_01590 [Zoogloea sp.]|jgi:hypothetical protein|nr:hypothetical protein [Zoogloea sp.]
MNPLATLARAAAAPRRAPTSTRAPLSAARFASTHIAVRAIASVQQWAESDDRLDAGETYAERLRALMLGIADPLQDGEISDDEHDVMRIAMTSAWDYLSSLGASDKDLDALLNDWDARTADIVRDLVTAVTPNDAQAAVAAVNFLFGPVVRTRTAAAVRIAGPLRLSAPQRLAIRKAYEKSHPAAMFRRPPSA